MNKLFRFNLLICLISIVGCTDSLEYNDEDVAAIVRGEEITIGELRFLYPDDELLTNIDGTVKAKLVIQEAKNMNINVSKDVKDTIEALSGYPTEDIHTSTSSSVHEFIKSQANKLGLDPEEYYVKYIEKTTKISTYVDAYVKEILGDPKDDFETYNEQANRLLNDLVKQNEDEIQILIK